MNDVISRIKFRLINKGLVSLITTVLRNFYEFIFPPKLGIYNAEITKDSICLEIGGPSAIFSQNGAFPVYHLASKIDNLNFSNKTIWKGLVKNTLYNRQIIGEAEDLSNIDNNQYNFLLSSEMIQHIANPILALKEWKRVLCLEGYMLLIIPNMKKTFDHRRPITKLQHLIDDYDNNTSEADLTHLDEILTLHDLTRDRLAGNFEHFKKRSLNNFNTRALHHHVFDESIAIQLVNYSGFNVLDLELFRNNIVILAQKIEEYI